jgi:hypothetical protein
VISREAVEAALGGIEPGSDTRSDGQQVEATQAIPRETVAQALSGGRHEVDAPEFADETPVFDEAQRSDDAQVASAASESQDDRQDPDDQPEQRDAETNIWDLEKSTRTMQLSRDAVDAALADVRSSESRVDHEGGRRVEVPSEPRFGGPAWEQPGDLEAIIQQFNAMQRVVYRAIKAEVGAGAANFIRSCCDTTSDSSDPLRGAELQADGSWDIEGLRRAVVENRISDPRLVYQELIDREIDLLRTHIGDARVLDLERQIERVEQSAANNR